MGSEEDFSFSAETLDLSRSSSFSEVSPVLEESLALPRLSGASEISSLEAESFVSPESLSSAFSVAASFLTSFPVSAVSAVVLSPTWSSGRAGLLEVESLQGAGFSPGLAWGSCLQSGFFSWLRSFPPASLSATSVAFSSLLSSERSSPSVLFCI